VSHELPMRSVLSLTLKAHTRSHPNLQECPISCQWDRCFHSPFRILPAFLFRGEFRPFSFFSFLTAKILNAFHYSVHRHHNCVAPKLTSLKNLCQQVTLVTHNYC
jgi:hypothetical protein